MISNAVTLMLLLQGSLSLGITSASPSTTEPTEASSDSRLFNNGSRMKSFKSLHGVKQDAILDVVGISKTSNSLTINNKEYSLDDMVPVDLYSDGATMSVDGKEEELVSSFEANTVPVMMRREGSETVLVTMDGNGDIDTIDIIGDDGSDTYLASLIPGRAFATLEDKDMDPTVLPEGRGISDYRVPDGRNRNLRKSIRHHDPNQKSHYDISVHNDTRSLQTSGSCSSYNVIEVAISFDSTLCSKRGGFSNAKAQVEKIVARASALYGSQGVCAKLKISHLEGFCSASSDPYRRSVSSGRIGCGDEGVLDAFQDYWRRNKGGIRRDTAQLLFESSVNAAGCAYINTLCSNNSGYGVSDTSYTNDLKRLTKTFTHELGHNIGMNHISDSSKHNIMQSGGPSGVSYTWSTTAVNFLKTNLPKNSCISKESGPGPNPNPPSNRVSRCYLETHHGTYLRFDKYNRDIVDQAPWKQSWEQFEIHERDGYAVIKSMAHGTYLRFGHDSWEVNQQTYVGAWEKFDIIGSLSGRFALRNKQHGTYLRAERYNTDIVDQAPWMQDWEMYRCVPF